jgi:hypothetical protein
LQLLPDESKNREQYWGIDKSNIIPTSQTDTNIRKSVRERKPPTNLYEPTAWNIKKINLNTNPESLQQAKSRLDWNEWNAAIEAEIKSLKDLGTYELVDRPIDKNIIKSKFVFKIKRKSDDTIDKYKARLVARGFSQIEGIDYFDTTAPVTKMTSLKVLLSIAAINDYEIDQMDVSTAFLIPELTEELYMEQPKGFEAVGSKNKVWKLKKSIYGLKQASHEWYQEIKQTLINLEFQQSKTDPCVFFKDQLNDEKFYIILYVDDLLLMTKNRKELDQVKNKLNEKYKMHDLGPAHQFLNMVITRNRKTKELHLSQPLHTDHVILKAKMENSVPVASPFNSNHILTLDMCPASIEEKKEMEQIPYRQVVGGLLYIALNTRPDIMAAVSICSRYVANPGMNHWIAVKRILRYLNGSRNNGIILGGTNKITLHGYSDADWGGDRDTRKSTTGYVFFVGNGCVSWQTKKQPTTALSTTEAEYLALSSASQEMLWLRQLFGEIWYMQKEATTIQQDNTGSIELTKNNKHHQRTKHIDIRHHFIKDLVLSDALRVIFCSTKDMLADIFTKSLPSTTFSSLAQKLNVADLNDFRGRGDVGIRSSQFISVQTFCYLLLKPMGNIDSSNNSVVHSLYEC